MLLVKNSRSGDVGCSLYVFHMKNIPIGELSEWEDIVIQISDSEQIANIIGQV